MFITSLVRYMMCYMQKEKEQIFGLSISLFAQSLWRAAMKNDDLDSTGRTAKSSFK